MPVEEFPPKSKTPVSQTNTVKNGSNQVREHKNVHVNGGGSCLHFCLRPHRPQGKMCDRLRSEAWKSGLASEAITRVPGQLEQNGQVLRIPYKICVNLVYSSFGYVEN